MKLEERRSMKDSKKVVRAISMVMALLMIATLFSGLAMQLIYMF